MDKLKIPYQVKSNLATYKEIDGRTIKAIANTYNFYDYDGDVLRMGSAKKSIEERGASSAATDKILHALFHDLTQLAGKSTLEVETVIDGKEVLYTEAFMPETTLGEDTLLNYKADIYNQHSIGFNYLQLNYVEQEADGWDKFLGTLINPEDAEKWGFGWEVTEIKLFEWSTVAFGANKLTPYLGTKSENRAVQYDAIVKKLNVLVDKANKHEIKDKKLFELQYKQLQQMIYELSIFEPSKEKALETSRQNEDDRKLFYQILNS